MVATALIVMLLAFGVMTFMYDIETDGQNFFLFALLGIILMLSAMILGSDATKKREYKYKKKPIVHIECNGSKCDTTYIYKF
jgi:uncharacterized protein YxeA